MTPFQKIINKRGTSVYRMSRELKASESNLYAIASGVHYPEYELATRIAKRLESTIQELWPEKYGK
jgi:lambda repressor-like predicted transcriptional regulator